MMTRERAREIMRDHGIVGINDMSPLVADAIQFAVAEATEELIRRRDDLLAANNAELERRRVAEQRLAEFESQARVLMAEIVRLENESDLAHEEVVARPCPSPLEKVYADPEFQRGMHQYVSTACQHELHDRCRKTCKFCAVACGCSCHAGEDSVVKDYLTTQDAGEASNPQCEKAIDIMGALRSALAENKKGRR
jgi:hypothetical protein